MTAQSFIVLNTKESIRQLTVELQMLKSRAEQIYKHYDDAYIAARLKNDEEYASRSFWWKMCNTQKPVDPHKLRYHSDRCLLAIRKIESLLVLNPDSVTITADDTDTLERYRNLLSDVDVS